MSHPPLPPIPLALALALTAAALAGCGSGGVDVGVEAQCNPLGGAACVTPWPSSIYQVEDATTATGMRVAIPEGALPVSADNIAVDPTPFNRYDGFSPSAPMLVAFETGVRSSDLVHHTDYDKSTTDESPTVIIDMSTGQRVAHFAEIDAWAEDTPDRQALYIRPAARLTGSTRYAVGVRRSLKAADGGELPISAGFKAIRDGVETRHALLEAMRPRYEAIFSAFDAEGIDRDDLVVAWDFVTRSDETIIHDVLTARDLALPVMGEAGANLSFEIVGDEQVGDGSVIARRIDGTFESPLFLTQGGLYRPGTTLARDAGTYLPVVQGTYSAPFTAIVPACAYEAEAPVPIMIYGHGLLGSATQVAGSYMRATAAELCVVVVGTDLRGMSARDVPNVVRALNNLNLMEEVFDVQVQGIVDHIALQHIARGPMAAELFVYGEGHGPVDREGQSLVDPTRVYYYGLSQGHIFGATFLAFDTFIERGVLGVGAANYSMMLERSTNWPTYQTIMLGAYPDPLLNPLLINLMQQRWDMTDPSGSAHLLLSGGIPGTPPKQVVLHMAVADNQVPPIATEWQARSMGLRTLAPSVDEPFGLPAAEGPLDSGLVIFDGGVAPAPLANLPPADVGMHSLTRNQPATLRQMSHFYQTGELTNTCGEAGCYCATGGCD